MAFKSTLAIDGKTFELLDLNSVLEQKYDSKGKPVSGVKGGYFDIIMEGTAEDTFADWITHPTTKKDGTFTIFRFDEPSKFKEIKFSGAYLTTLVESYADQYDIGYQSRAINRFIPKLQEIRELLFDFQARVRINYIMYCEISAEKIKIDGVDHDNKW